MFNYFNERGKIKCLNCVNSLKLPPVLFDLGFQSFWFLHYFFEYLKK